MRRRLQMGAAEVVAVVEGQSDRFFYGQLMATICDPLGITYTVKLAQELPNTGSGKSAILKYYRFLQRHRSLHSQLGDKTTTLMFFVDVDADKLNRKCCRSLHVIYTELFCLENYLFKYGNLPLAVGAAASLDPAEVARAIPDAVSWRQAVQLNWLDWLVVCVFASARQLAAFQTYGLAKSPIHHGSYGGVISSAFAVKRQELAVAHGRTATSFERAWATTMRSVRRRIVIDRGDDVFKGKWYGSFLLEDVKRIAAGRVITTNDWDRRLCSHLAQTMNVEQPWAQGLRNSINAVIASRP